MTEDPSRWRRLPIICMPALAMLFTSCLVQWRLPMPFTGRPGVLPLSTVVLAIVVLLFATLERRRLGSFRPGWWPGLMFTALAVGFIGTTWTGIGDSLKELIQYVEIYVVVTCFFAALVHLGFAERITTGLAVMHGAALVLLFTGGDVVGLSHSKHAAFLVISLPFWVHWLRSRNDKLWQYAMIILESAALGITTKHAGFVLLWVLVLILCTVLGDSAGRSAQGARLPAPAVCIAILVAIGASLAVRPSRPSPWEAMGYHYDDTHIRRFYVEAQAALAAPFHVPFGGGPGHYRETINTLKLYREDRIHPTDTRVPRDGNCQYAVILVENGLPAVLLLVAGLVTGAWRCLRLRHSSRDDMPGIGPGTLFCSVIGLIGSGFISLSFSQGIGIVSGAIIGMSLMPVKRFAHAGTESRAVRPGGWYPAIISALAAFAVIAGGILLTSGDPTAGVSPVNRQLSAWLQYGESHGGTTLPVLPVEDTFSGQAAFGIIHVQAESCSLIKEPFKRIADPTAEKEACLAIADLAGKGTGSVTYEIDVPVSGHYTFTARVQWQDGCGNSIAFANSTSRVVVTSDVYGRWHLLKSPKPIELEEGRRTVSLINLEDGVRIDSWTLQYRLE